MVLLTDKDIIKNKITNDYLSCWYWVAKCEQNVIKVCFIFMFVSDLNLKLEPWCLSSRIKW